MWLLFFLMSCIRYNSRSYPRRRYRYGEDIPILVQLIVLYFLLWLTMGHH